VFEAASDSAETWEKRALANDQDMFLGDRRDRFHRLHHQVPFDHYCEQFPQLGEQLNEV